ncbi:hypothetical protein ACW14X_27990 [Nocardioides sp. YJ-D4]
MALRSPLYLDGESLLAQAEYHGIQVPTQADIVEKTVTKRGASGGVGVGPVRLGGNAGQDVEFQSAYRMEPSEKATASKVIDALVHQGDVTTNPDADTVLTKDSLLEVEGTTRVTAASLAGKMFFILRQAMESADLDMTSIEDLNLDDLPGVAEGLRDAYLSNHLVPVPLLVELTGSNLPQRVYVSVAPDHFVDSASADRVEGDLRVLGSVTQFISEGNEGFLSAERWLLHGWEYLIRRHMMLNINDIVRELGNDLGLKLPEDDVYGYITGPAVVLDAIAIY